MTAFVEIIVTYMMRDKRDWWGCWDVLDERCNGLRRCSRLTTKWRSIAWKTRSPKQQYGKIRRQRFLLYQGLHISISRHVRLVVCCWPIRCAHVFYFE